MCTVVCADKTIDILEVANLLLQGRSLRGVRLHAFPSLGLCSVMQRTLSYVRILQCKICTVLLFQNLWQSMGDVPAPGWEGLRLAAAVL